MEGFTPKRTSQFTLNETALNKDINFFGRLISFSLSRIDKSAKAASFELGMSSTMFSRYITGVALPTEEKLSDIARVCGINEAELANAFAVSKEARRKELEARKHPTMKPKIDRSF